MKGVGCDSLRRHLRSSEQSALDDLAASLAMLGLQACNAAPTPRVAGCMQPAEADDKELDLAEAKNYRSVIGTLAYLATDRVYAQYEVSVSPGA